MWLMQNANLEELTAVILCKWVLKIYVRIIVTLHCIENIVTSTYFVLSLTKFYWGRETLPGSNRRHGNFSETSAHVLQVAIALQPFPDHVGGCKGCIYAILV